MRFIDVLACIAILPFLLASLVIYAAWCTLFGLGMLGLVVGDAIIRPLRKG